MILKKFSLLSFVSQIIFCSLIAQEIPSKDSIEGYVDNNGVKIHYIGTKQNLPNTPSLLFVPGLSMPGWIFEKQLEYFSKKYTVVAMDPRSQGSSSQTTEGHYALARAGDIKAVVDSLNMNPVVLVGWSLSVPEIVAYIDYYGSQGIAGVILVDGLVGLDKTSELFKMTMISTQNFQTDRLKNTREFVKGMFKQPQPCELIEKLINESLITPTNTFAALKYNCYTSDYTYALANIDKPALVISSYEASYLMKDVSNAIPNSQFEIINNAGHAIFVDQPDLFNEILDKFLLKITWS